MPGLGHADPQLTQALQVQVGAWQALANASARVSPLVMISGKSAKSTVKIGSAGR